MYCGVTQDKLSHLNMLDGLLQGLDHLIVLIQCGVAGNFFDFLVVRKRNLNYLIYGWHMYLLTTVVERVRACRRHILT